MAVMHECYACVPCMGVVPCMGDGGGTSEQPRGGQPREIVTPDEITRDPIWDGSLLAQSISQWRPFPKRLTKRTSFPREQGEWRAEGRAAVPLTAHPTEYYLIRTTSPQRPHTSARFDPTQPTTPAQGGLASRMAQTVYSTAHTAESCECHGEDTVFQYSRIMTLNGMGRTHAHAVSRWPAPLARSLSD